MILFWVYYVIWICDLVSGLVLNADAAAKNKTI